MEGQGFSGAVRLKRFGRWVSLVNIAFKLSRHATSPRVRRLAERVVRRGMRGAVYLNFGDAMLLVADRAREGVR